MFCIRKSEQVWEIEREKKKIKRREGERKERDGERKEIKRGKENGKNERERERKCGEIKRQSLYTRISISLRLWLGVWECETVRVWECMW